MNPNDVTALVSVTFLFSLSAVLILRGPLGKALARRIEGASGQVDAHLFPLVEELQGKVAELEERVGRVHDLEERLDFAERLLAKQREQPRVGA